MPEFNVYVITYIEGEIPREYVINAGSLSEALRTFQHDLAGMYNDFIMVHEYSPANTPRATAFRQLQFTDVEVSYRKWKNTYE